MTLTLPIRLAPNFDWRKTLTLLMFWAAHLTSLGATWERAMQMETAR